MTEKKKKGENFKSRERPRGEPKKKETSYPNEKKSRGIYFAVGGRGGVLASAQGILRLAPWRSGKEMVTCENNRGGDEKSIRGGGAGGEKGGTWM